MRTTSPHSRKVRQRTRRQPMTWAVNRVAYVLNESKHRQSREFAIPEFVSGLVRGCDQQIKARLRRARPRAAQAPSSAVTDLSICHKRGSGIWESDGYGNAGAVPESWIPSCT
jgi:hypothetical protein